MRNGQFITFEGIDGAGKSSHIDWLSEAIQRAGHKVVVTREPGGTPLAETLRDLVLSQAMPEMSELLLMFAARADHVETVIKPALAAGRWVLCDRFVDSSFAYQGGGRGMSVSILETLEQWVSSDCHPVRTYWFDLEPVEAQRRREAARVADRFEAQDAAFFERVRNAYCERQAGDSARIRVIDSARSIDAIRAELSADLNSLPGFDRG
ncbi:MAG: dTMP kinase [Burkholderiaceae bacterium]